MKINSKTIKHIVFCSLLLFVVMLLFIHFNYFSFSIARRVYSPFYIVVLLALLFRQYIFGYIFTASICLGLIGEYIIHLSQENPSMRGGFLNVFILFSGAIIGIIFQILVKKQKK